MAKQGKKIIFSLKCPASNTSLVDGKPACTGRWNIWEYNMTEGGLTKGTFRRLTASTADDDGPVVDEQPDGRCLEDLDRLG